MTTLAVCVRALSCIRMKSGNTAPAKGLTIGWRTSSRYLTAARAPLSMTCKFVHPRQMIQGKFKMGCTVLPYKNWSMTSASEVFLVEFVTNSLVTDTDTGRLSEVNLQRSRSFVAALKSHLPDVAVTASTALTRASNIINQ